MPWVLGLDLGTNSIGWSAFKTNTQNNQTLDSLSLLDAGVVLFSDGRERASGTRIGDSLAVERRMARGMRRNRDRRKNRINRLVRDLVSLGLLPADEAVRKSLFTTQRGDPDRWNPYRLRAEALERALEPFELGRVILHLALRRGYKSNRKESGGDDDGGTLKERIGALDELLEGRTLGQYLWQLHQEERSRRSPGVIRFRPGRSIFPARKHYAEEYDRIGQAQKADHALTEEDWARLKNQSVLFQHPLKPVERGRCDYLPDEPRHWRDTPIAHRFRIASELNSLRLINADLSISALNAEQIAAIRQKLWRQQTVQFSSLRRLKGTGGKRLFPADSRFNLEDERRKDLKGHYFANVMAKDPDLAAVWALTDGGAALDDMVEVLFAKETDDEVTEVLCAEHGLTLPQARAMAALRLSRATGALSRSAMEALTPIMEDQGLVYADAVTEWGEQTGRDFHHSLRVDHEFDRLPYYGAAIPTAMLGADPKADAKTDPERHYGRINNPTVHIALNQLRKLVNALTDRFDGPPERIHVEMLRELALPRHAREDQLRQNAARERDNKRIRDFCAGLGIPHATALDIKKVRLWEELGNDQLTRCCPFSGRPIAAHQLFNGEVDIEHIIPFSQSLDDGMANLTVAFRQANMLKGNRTPFEAFGGDHHARDGYLWDEILSRAAQLPKNKQWRFGPDARDRLEKDGQDFIARQLTDSAYMAKVATRYLRSLKGVRDVIPNRGRLTAMLRGKWGLNGILSDDNKKTRDDHRHHAIDAIVTALISRSLLQSVSRETRRGADGRVRIEVPDLPNELMQQIRTRVPGIVPHVKPDHGLQGRMVKETAYGFVDPCKGLLVTRKPIESLTIKEVSQIRDEAIRDAAIVALPSGNPKPAQVQAALAEFGKLNGIKRVRIVVQDQTVRPVGTAQFKGYKPDSDACCDVWRLPPKKRGGPYRFVGTFWSYLETADGTPDPEAKRPHPAAKCVMRLFKQDTVALGTVDKPKVFRVFGFSTTNNKLDVRPVERSDTPKTYVSINKLGNDGLRRLNVGIDGRILRDCGGFA